MTTEEEEYERAARFENRIDKMQYDQSLPWHKRKMANDAIKLIISLPEYPRVSAELLRSILYQIEHATQYEEIKVAI